MNVEYNIIDFITNHLRLTKHYDGNDNHYHFFLPLKENEGGEIKGGKCNLTVEQHIQLADYSYCKVIDKKKTGMYDFRRVCDLDECDLLELHFQCVQENLCVIDIDEIGCNIGNFPEIIKKMPYTLSRRKKLPHYYCILDGIEKGVLKDIIKTTTDCLNFCKGDIVTSHIWEKPNSIFYNYNPEIGIPHIHIDILKNHLNEKIINKIWKKEGTINKLNYGNTDFQDDITVEYNGEDAETVTEQYNENGDDLGRKIHKLKQVSQCYKIERINNYDTWFELTMAIKNTFRERGREIWDEISRRGSNYNYDKNIQKWFNYKESNGKNSLKFGSLMMWAKNDNEELYNKIIGTKYNINWERLTDFTFANMMYNLYFENKLLFTGKSKKETTGYYFNGTYWIDMGNNNNEIKKGFFTNLYNFYQKELRKIKDELSEIEYNVYSKKIMQLDSANTRNNIIRILQDENYRNGIEWNTKKHLFAFNNRIYDLEKGEFIEPNPDDYINLTCGYDYIEYEDEELEYAKEKIHAFLDSIIKKEYLKNEKDFLLKLLSSFLVQKNKEEKGYFWLGCGRNGKGCLSQVTKNSLGNYFGEMDVSYYTIHDKSSNGPNQHLYNNCFSRVINTSEIGDEDDLGKTVKFITDKFKRITGRDTITARAVHSQDVANYEAGKILIQTNFLPEFTDSGESIRERISIMKFPYTFTDDIKKLNENPNVYKKIDRKIKDEFSKNIYRIAFIEILFEYYKIYQEEGLNEPPSVVQHLNEYLGEIENVEGWFQENYVFKEGAEKIKLKDVLLNFKIDNDLQKYEFTKFKRKILGMHGYENHIKPLKGIYYLKNHILKT